MTMPHHSTGRAIVSVALGAFLAAGGVVQPSAHEAHQALLPPSQGPGLSAVADHPSLAAIKAAPDFALLDGADNRVALSELRGRVVLLSFIYTTCVTTCPLLTHRMGLLRHALRHAGLWPRSVSFLSVTVDPERDTRSALADYAQNFDAVDPNWRFLRDEAPAMRPVLAAYDEWTKQLPDGELDHPARVYLIDRRGNVREIYALAFFDERQALIDIQTLVQESP